MSASSLTILYAVQPLLALRVRSVRACDDDTCATQADGEGVFLFADGDRHEGQYRRDRRHGYGVYVWANSGHTFEGEWVGGLPHYGVKSAPEYVYEGEWLGGKPHGSGRTDFGRGVWGARVVAFAVRSAPPAKSPTALLAGDCYLGSYAAGARHGRGVYRWHDGGEFHGEWHFGVPHGRGRVVYASGAEFYGVFASGVRNGVGISTTESGKRYAQLEGGCGRWLAWCVCGSRHGVPQLRGNVGRRRTLTACGSGQHRTWA